MVPRWWQCDPRTGCHQELGIMKVGCTGDKQKSHTGAKTCLILNCIPVFAFSGANPEPAGPPKKSERLKEEAKGTGRAGASWTLGEVPGNSQIISVLLVTLLYCKTCKLPLTLCSQITQNLIGTGGTTLHGSWEFTWRTKGSHIWGEKDGIVNFKTPGDMT